MSTILDTAVETVQNIVEAPSRSAARTAYRASVVTGQRDAAAGPEWDADRKRYTARLGACKTLAEDVPRLEARAAELAAAVADAESFARSPIGDDVTVADLRAKIRAIDPKILVGTPGELSAALQLLVVGKFHQLTFALIQARGAVDDARERARRVLIETGTATGQDAEVLRIGARIEAVQRRIREREPILRAEGGVAAVRQECEALARGDRPPDGRTYQFGAEPPTLKSLYQAARKRLDKLLGLAARKPDAIRANEQDRQELARLQGQAAEAQRRALARLADPTAMRWCGE